MGIYDKEREKLGLNSSNTSTGKYDEERQRLAHPIINGATTLGVGGSRAPTPKVLPKALPKLTSTKVRTGTLQKLPSKTNILEEAFDQEPYYEKFKRGNIKGGLANIAGSTLAAGQSALMNVSNNIESLVTGKGFQPLQHNMTQDIYGKAVADRWGTKPLSEQISDKNKFLGGAYKLGMEVVTDPLELTPLGFANDIKLAKGLSQNSQAYGKALQNGKLNPASVVRTDVKLQRETTPDLARVNAPRVQLGRVGASVKPLPKEPKPLPRLQPRPLPQAPNLTAQPLKPNLGIKTPQEQTFVKTPLKSEPLKVPEVELPQANAIPKRDRLLFDTEFIEKNDIEYREFMDSMSDYGEPMTKTGADLHAGAITGKGVRRSKDIQRNADYAYRNSPEGRKWFKDSFENDLYKSKGEYARAVKGQLDNLFNDIVVNKGIKKGSKESAAMQWIGEGKRQVKNTGGKITGNLTENYGLDDLKRDFDYPMKNGRKMWENIAAAEKTARKTYDEYIEKINGALRQIYPDVEANIAKLEVKLAKTTDKAAKKKVLQAIEDATMGKRLQPRKDYYHHFKEMESKFIGLDNIINSATNIDPRLLEVSEFTKPNSKWTGFMQRRKGGDTYTEDAIGGLLEYIPQAEYKVHIEPNIPKLRNIIKDLKESTIQSRNANSFIGELMQVANDLAGKTNQWDRSIINILGDERGRKVMNSLSTVSGRMRANAVVGNLNTTLAQPFNLPNVVGYAKNPVDLVVGFRQSIQASMGNKQAQELLAKSDFLTERYMDRSRRQFDTGMMDDVNRFCSWMLEVGDKAVADGAWMTFYRQAGKKGMKGDDAIRFADEFTRKSVAGRGIAEMPLSQKAKVTKMIAPFQVEVRNAINVLEDLGVKKDVPGLIGVFVTSFLMNEMLEKATGRRITIDPIDILRNGATELYQGADLKTAAKNTAYGMAGEVISNVPGGSYVASAAQNALGIDEFTMRKLFGENDPSRFGTGNIALQTLGAPIGQALKGQNINLLKPALATLPKFGGKQIERTIRGLQDMAVLPKEKLNLSTGASLEKQNAPGSFTPTGKLRFPIEPSAKNYIMAPAFTSWSTKEGKDYIQNKGRPFSEKQTENFKAISGNKSMFEFISKNRGLQKKGEVIEALRKSTLTDTQKRALLTQFYGYKL